MTLLLLLMFIFTTRFVNEVGKGAAATGNIDVPVEVYLPFLLFFSALNTNTSRTTTTIMMNSCQLMIIMDFIINDYECRGVSGDR